MYLPSCVIHQISSKLASNHDMLGDLLARNFEHLSANRPTNDSIKRELLRVAQSLGKGSIAELKRAIYENKIGEALPNPSEDERRAFDHCVRESGSRYLVTSFAPSGIAKTNNTMARPFLIK